MWSSTVVLLAVLSYLSLGTVLAQSGNFQILDDLRTLKRKVKDMEGRLGKAETQLKDLKGLEARLNATQKELLVQRTEVEKMMNDTDATLNRQIYAEMEIEELRNYLVRVGQRVAFSVSLSNSEDARVGPFTGATLVFKSVFLNVGKAYDSRRGVFSAPVDGLYYFIFSTFDQNTRRSGGVLVHLGSKVSTSYRMSSASSGGGSNAVVLKLLAGEKVWMEVKDRSKLFDNQDGYTTFSGFLLNVL